MSAGTDAPTGVKLSAQRLQLVQQATYQTEGMLRALHTAASKPGDALPYTVQGLAVRLNQLNNMIQNALGHDKIGDAELEDVLTGEFGAAYG